jgi:hypothetical protein
LTDHSQRSTAHLIAPQTFFSLVSGEKADNQIVLNPMPRRTSINDVQELEQLNDLELIVKDKRNEKRADSKKERRNRHYVKLLIKQQLTHTTDEGESGDR